LFTLLFNTGSSHCCCTAVHSRKRGEWKTVQGILASRIKLFGGPDAARGP